LPAGRRIPALALQLAIASAQKVLNSGLPAGYSAVFFRLWPSFLRKWLKKPEWDGIIAHPILKCGGYPQ
jgi:hypothetical protein